jgi:type VI secretion system protein ImpM
MNAASPPGWYGKLPNLGDFASRRLPADFIDAWDRWLQEGLHAARTALGDVRWREVYLVAPVLRFWLAPGVLGAGGWAGLVMPSIDRVGRHFPLTLARPDDSLDATLGARTWFHALDQAARRVLDVNYTVDDFEQALAALPQAGSTAPGTEAAALPAALSRCGNQPTGVWWCGDASHGTAFRCYAGLPPAAEFATLLGAAR